MDVWHVDGFGFVGEVFVVEGVAGFPGVWGEGPDGGVGGDVVEDDFFGIGGGHGCCELMRNVDCWRLEETVRL